jgi:hypothetical protein
MEKKIAQIKEKLKQIKKECVLYYDCSYWSLVDKERAVERIEVLSKESLSLINEMEKGMRKIIYSQEGKLRCAVFKDFDYLPTSSIGFGNTDEEAKEDLIKDALKADKLKEE